MQGRELQEAVRDVSISSFFYLELRLRPEGTLNFERIVLPLVCTKIAGSVPTWTFPQVLESEVRASKSAEECPYLVEGRCPYAGTGLQWAGFNGIENYQDLLFGCHPKERSELDRAIR